MERAEGTQGKHTSQLRSAFFPFNYACSLLLHYCVFIKKTYWNVLFNLPNDKHDFSKSALSELLKEAAVICLLIKHLPTKLRVLKQSVKGTGKMFQTETKHYLCSWINWKLEQWITMHRQRIVSCFPASTADLQQNTFR